MPVTVSLLYLPDICCLSQFGLCCYAKTLTDTDLGKKEFIISFRLESIIKRNQDRNSIRNLEAAYEAEVMKEHCFLLCLSCSLNLLFNLLPRVALPTVGWAFSQQPLTSAMPTDLPTSYSDGGSSLVEVLSSQVTLICVKLTNRQHSTVADRARPR